MRNLVAILILLLAVAVQAELVIEDFETGDFSAQPWQQTGDVGWIIASENPDPQNGQYYARSGTMQQGQQSVLEITVYTNRIRYYYRGSNAYSGDSVSFYINNQLVQGGVTLSSSNWWHRDYILETGWHTFKWVCYRGNTWSDTTALMLDNIRFGVDFPGHGTAEHPYLIHTAEQFNSLGTDDFYLDKHFKLMADIDLTGYGHIHQDNPDITIEFNRIGAHNKPFQGYYDGNNHKISNLTYHAYASPKDRDIGIFHQIGNKGVVTHLEVDNFDYRGHYGIGGIAGRNAGNIFSCTAKGKIRSTGQYGNSGGGIAAYNDGFIRFCNAQVEINAIYGPIGGIAAQNVGGQILSCIVSNTLLISNSGDISGIAQNSGGAMIKNCTVHAELYGGGYRIGGISSSNSNSTIYGCHSNITIKGREYLGGIAGQNTYYGNIIRCSTTGNIGAGYGLAGGLAGYNDDNTLIYGCYSLTNVYGLDIVAGDYQNGQFKNTGLYGSGGLAGISRGRIIMSYADCDVADGSWTYGLAYPSGNNPIIENSFFVYRDGQGYLKDYWTKGLDREDFFDHETLANADWDFHNYWQYIGHNRLMFDLNADIQQHFADTNNDGSVDIVDFAAMANNFLKKLGQIGFNQLVDFNLDGITDLEDFAILSQHWLAGAVE